MSMSETSKRWDVVLADLIAEGVVLPDTFCDGIRVVRREEIPGDSECLRDGYAISVRVPRPHQELHHERGWLFGSAGRR